MNGTLIAWWKKRTEETRTIISQFLFSRSALLIGGVASLSLFATMRSIAPDWEMPHSLWLRMWAVWDSGWYLNIAEKGYSVVSPLFHEPYINLGFFPLYPFLSRLVGFILLKHYFLGALVVSNGSLFVAAYFLYKLVRLDENEEVAHRTLRFLFLIPTAFVLSAIFSESLFLCLSILAIYCARMHYWNRALLFAFLLGLTKLAGVFIVIPLFLIALPSWKRNLESTLNRIALLIAPFAGVAVFCVMCRYISGDFFAYFHAQTTLWYHVFSNPLSVIMQALAGTDIDSFLDAAALVIALGLIIACARRIRLEYFLFALALLLFAPVSGTVLGSLRYLCFLFPLPIALASITKNKQVEYGLMLSLGILQGVLLVFWVNGFRFLS